MNKAASSRAELPANLQRALDLAIAAKGVGPVVLHLTEVAGYTDHALIVSGRSDRHVGGITEAIVTGLKAQGIAPIGSDGLDEHLCRVTCDGEEATGLYQPIDPVAYERCAAGRPGWAFL